MKNKRPEITPTSVRIRTDDLEKLEKYGLKLSEVLKEAVSRALDFKRCPTCGNKLKERKSG